MFQHWLIELIGHVSGLSDAQLKQIEKSLPATKALVDLLNRARPIIEQAEKLYSEAEPLIDEAKKEWQTVGPAVQILIDVISHHVNRGGSPAEATETIRAALDGSINNVGDDHFADAKMNCATVFGGTGFLGRRVVRHLTESGISVRIVSRHRGLGEDAGIERVAADAHDQRSVQAAVAGADLSSGRSLSREDMRSGCSISRVTMGPQEHDGEKECEHSVVEINRDIADWNFLDFDIERLVRDGGYGSDEQVPLGSPRRARKRINAHGKAASRTNLSGS